MDLNYLLHRHQVSLMRLQSATRADVRFAHRALANGYAARVNEAMSLSGASATPLANAR